MAKKKKPQTKGPFSHQNWHAALDHKTLEGTNEYPLFTDAHIVGNNVQYGPYLLINCVSIGNPVSPSIVLRIDRYILDPVNDLNALGRWDKTNAELYHKGDLNDEIAALISLCMGIKLKSGILTRRFLPGGDPKGNPMSYPSVWNREENPILLARKVRRSILSGVLGEHYLSDTILLENYRNLSAQDAVTLVRAARLYQDALWIAESEPETAWLFLVSAVEIAANHWKKTEDSPINLLRASKFAYLEQILETAGGQELVERVAKDVATYTGAIKKFVNFLINFLPDPPANHSENPVQISWQIEKMKKYLETIYRYRSDALHGGKPFPLPMCYPPFTEGQEKPNSMMITGIAVWSEKDLPMLLHVFEYIVRHALLKWWKSMDTNNEAAAN